MFVLLHVSLRIKNYYFLVALDHALVGHGMTKEGVGDEFDCQLKCLGNSSCKSFNVHPGADDAKRVCELNNKTRQMKPVDFKRKKGSSYYGSMKVSCLMIQDIGILIFRFYFTLISNTVLCINS